MKVNLPAFLSPWKVNLKISHRIPTQQVQKMTCQHWPNLRRWLPYNDQIPEDDHWEWPNPGRWLTEIGQIPAYNKPESQRGFDETSSLTTSSVSGDEQFQLVVSRNWYEFLYWLSGYRKTPISHFDWTKPWSQKSLSCIKWFYVLLVRLYHKNFFTKLAGPPVYYSGSNEPSLAPQFKWPDNTFESITFFL